MLTTMCECERVFMCVLFGVISCYFCVYGLDMASVCVSVALHSIQILCHVCTTMANDVAVLERNTMILAG